MIRVVAKCGKSGIWEWNLLLSGMWPIIALNVKGVTLKGIALSSRSLPVWTNVSVDQYLKSKSTLHSKADPTTLQSE